MKKIKLDDIQLEEAGFTGKDKGDFSPKETKAGMLQSLSSFLKSTKTTAAGFEGLISDLTSLKNYIEHLGNVSRYNVEYLQDNPSKEMFGAGKDNEFKTGKAQTGKDVLNSRWQSEYLYFAATGYKLMLDKLSWMLWNWDYDPDTIEDANDHLKEQVEGSLGATQFNQLNSLQDVVDKVNSLRVDEEEVEGHTPVLPKQILTLWQEGPYSPIAKRIQHQGYHSNMRAIQKKRPVYWHELLNPFWDNKEKNTEVQYPKFRDDEFYEVGAIAAQMDTTPYEIISLFQDGLFITDTEDDDYKNYEIKGSVLNCFVQAMIQVKRDSKAQRSKYLDTANALHGGQKRLDFNK
tara:strand:+ start:13664 stop:14704 length:1041 start_codon:yes stop_codon:yes gene_type:complete